MSNLVADELQQQKSTSGSSSVSQELEFEVTEGTGSPKLESWRWGKNVAWSFFKLQSCIFSEPKSLVH